MQFGIVGLSNTLISYVVYAVGIAAHLHYLAASVLGFLVSVANAFYWNNKYVFSAREGGTPFHMESFYKDLSVLCRDRPGAGECSAGAVGGRSWEFTKGWHPSDSIFW